jgi:hypothetical protein
MATFGTRVLTDPVSQWFTNKPLSLLPTDVDRSATVTVTADSTKDVKGAWTEIIASTTTTTNFLNLSLSGTVSSGFNTGMLLDIGIGGSGSEAAVIENIPCGFMGSMIFQFPIQIKAGSRVSARCAAFIVSDTVSVQATTQSIPNFVAPTSLTTFGAVTTDSRGTNIPGDNAYIEFVASTSEQYRAIVLVPCCGNVNSALSMATENSTYTLGIGASGLESAVMTVPVGTVTNESIVLQVGTRTNIYAPESPIAAGNRLAVKQSVGRAYRDAIIFGVV